MNKDDSQYFKLVWRQSYLAGWNASFILWVGQPALDDNHGSWCTKVKLFIIAILEKGLASDVGYQILQTMIINAIKPPIMVALTGWSIPALKRWLSRSRIMDDYKTKKTSITAYKALYSRADYKV